MKQHRLELLSSLPIEIVWHENRKIYFSAKKIRGRLFLRLHRLFYDAPTPVLEALLEYIHNNDSEAKAVVRQMAYLYFLNTSKEPKPLQPQGKVYDLQKIFTPYQVAFNLEGVTIGWSDRRGGYKRFRSIRFGSYDQHTKQIRIHPLLDQTAVPLYFLEFVVYHEMLHALYPSQMDSLGRCSIHTKEFRDKERQFPFFEEAKAWEKKSLTVLKGLYHGRTQ